MFGLRKNKKLKEKAFVDKNTMLEVCDVLLLNEVQKEKIEGVLFFQVCQQIYGVVVLHFKDTFIYLKKEDISKLGVREEEIFESALENNLKNIKKRNPNLGIKENKEDKVKMLNDGAVILYSSLILNKSFQENLKNNIFCFPSRYMLAFTEKGNEKGILELKHLCDIQVGEDIDEDEFVSDKLYILEENHIIEYDK